MTDTIPIETDDGVRSLLAIHSPPGVPRAAVLLLPALGVKASFYEPFGRALAGRGVAVAATDWRGNGTSELRVRRGVDFGYHELVHQDVVAAARGVRERFPDAPLYLLGHSLGGQLAAIRLGLSPDLAAGLILVASCTVYWRNWGALDGLRVLALTQAAAGLARVVGYFPGHRVRFAGREARGVIADWAYTARTGRYAMRGERDGLDAAIARAALPVLSVSIAGDWLAPRRAVEHLLTKLAAAEKRHVRLPRESVGGRGSPHFAWAREPAPVVAAIDAWLPAAPGD